MEKILIEFIEKELLGSHSDIGLTPSDDLLGSGMVDSLGIMRLIQFIEVRFELKVPFEDMTIENFMSVGDIERYLEKRKNLAPVVN